MEEHGDAVNQFPSHAAASAPQSSSTAVGTTAPLGWACLTWKLSGVKCSTGMVWAREKRAFLQGVGLIKILNFNHGVI